MVLEMTRVGQNGIEKDKSMTRWIKDEQEQDTIEQNTTRVQDTIEQYRT